MYFINALGLNFGTKKNKKNNYYISHYYFNLLSKDNLIQI
jgi:hypothetical protein